jgi:hypothetical protein
VVEIEQRERKKNSSVFHPSSLQSSSQPLSTSTSLTIKKNVQLAGHCLAVASWLTHLRHHFMSSYWIGFLVRFWFSFRIAGKGERERRSL